MDNYKTPINEIYEYIGNIVQIVQYIEWNLLNKMNRDTFGEMTLGQIIDLIEKTDFLPESKVLELEEILKKRNDLIHQYFKRLDFEAHNDNLPFLNNQKRYLVNLYNHIQSFNSWLCSI